MSDVLLDIVIEDNELALDISIDTNVTVTPTGSSPDIVYGGPEFIE